MFNTENLLFPLVIHFKVCLRYYCIFYNRFECSICLDRGIPNGLNLLFNGTKNI